VRRACPAGAVVVTVSPAGHDAGMTTARGKPSRTTNAYWIGVDGPDRPRPEQLERLLLNPGYVERTNRGRELSTRGCRRSKELT
jgi:hypothetical protein